MSDTKLSEEQCRPPKPRGASKRRCQAERVHGRFDNGRASVVRCEREVATFRGRCVFAAILVWLRALLTQ